VLEARPARSLTTKSLLENCCALFATRLLTVHSRCVGQVTDVCGAVRHAGRSRSMPVGYRGNRMIEHDGNPAAQQAGYPVGDEDDPDPPALEQGTGRDLITALLHWVGILSREPC
jgi:hypothetical protein